MVRSCVLQRQTSKCRCILDATALASVQHRMESIATFGVAASINVQMAFLGARHDQRIHHQRHANQPCIVPICRARAKSSATVTDAFPLSGSISD